MPFLVIFDIWIFQISSWLNLEVVNNRNLYLRSKNRIWTSRTLAAPYCNTKVLVWTLCKVLGLDNKILHSNLVMPISVIFDIWKFKMSLNFDFSDFDQHLHCKRSDYSGMCCGLQPDLSDRFWIIQTLAFRPQPKGSEQLSSVRSVGDNG